MTVADGPQLEPPQEHSILAVPTAALIALGFLIPFLLPGFLVGFDAYYHVQLSEIMRTQGVFVQEFPWATESIWVEAWFDKEWLFHLLMVPFLYLGKTLGAKVFIVVLNAILLASLWFLCRTLKIGARATAICLGILPWCCYGIFWMRLVVCRPHTLSIALLALGIALTLRRRHVLLGLLSLVYALSYTGHWQMLGVVFLSDVLYALLGDDGKRRDKILWKKCPMLVAAFIGMAIGEVIHPQFPANVNGLFVQNILVLLNAWKPKTESVQTINELKATGWQIVWLVAPVVLGMILIFLQTVRRKLKWNRDVVFLAVCSCGYLVLAVLSLRFLEYFVPVAVVFLALVISQNPLREWLDERPVRITVLVTMSALTLLLALKAWQLLFLALVPVLAASAIVGYLARRQLRYHWLLITCAVWILAFGLAGYVDYHSRYVAKRAMKTGGGHPFAEAGRQIRDSAAPGTIVFVTRFQNNCALWFHAPDSRYLVFLDPIFMRRRSAERYALWEQVRRGQHPDPVTAIRDVFGAEFVFVMADMSVPDPNLNAELRLIQQLEQAGATLLHEGDDNGRLYQLP